MTPFRVDRRDWSTAGATCLIATAVYALANDLTVRRMADPWCLTAEAPPAWSVVRVNGGGR